MTEPGKITAAEQRAADRRKRQTEALRANLKRRKASTETEDATSPQKTTSGDE
jgi:hypothetical protein